MTKPNDAIAKQYTALVEDYFVEGLSVRALSAKYGPSENTIHKHIAGYQLRYKAEFGAKREREKLPEDPRAFEGMRGLSFLHATIGLRMESYRTDHNLTPTLFGMMLKQSRIKIRLMEKGAHDFTINEIEQIAAIIGVTFDQLINPKKAA